MPDFSSISSAASKACECKQKNNRRGYWFAIVCYSLDYGLSIGTDARMPSWQRCLGAMLGARTKSYAIVVQ